MKKPHRTIKSLLRLMLSVLWIVHGFFSGRECVAASVATAVALEPNASETILLSSFFWPYPQRYCPGDAIAPYDRCHLWDGYCTDSPILTCEPRRNPFINTWSPSQACSLCNQGGRRVPCPRREVESVPCRRAVSPVEQPATDSIPAYPSPPASLENSIPSPKVEPAEDVIPRNFIPTARRTPDAQPSVPDRDTADRLVRPKKTNVAKEMPGADATASTPGIRLEFAASPPEPETYDYHLPRSLRDAVSRSDGSPLAEQLQELIQSSR
ncbi:MAG: hypothetical protein O2931_03225 [Planctomycetota bacterium]|nr:hypothetical protein [Planctomycetota bacterium]MDA1177789.1 hypothetical protein [Planctomycetota bacterium]